MKFENDDADVAGSEESGPSSFENVEVGAFDVDEKHIDFLDVGRHRAVERHDGSGNRGLIRLTNCSAFLAENDWTKLRHSVSTRHGALEKMKFDVGESLGTTTTTIVIVVSQLMMMVSQISLLFGIEESCGIIMMNSTSIEEDDLNLGNEDVTAA